jgi:hypothetical protein
VPCLRTVAVKTFSRHRLEQVVTAVAARMIRFAYPCFPVSLHYVQASFLRVLIVRPFDLDIKHCFMEVSVPPRLLEHFHFIVVQCPSGLFFQLLATDLCPDLFCFFILVLRLEARLHAQAEFCRRRDLVGIASDCGWCCVGVNAEVCVAHRSEGEEAGLRF